MTVAHPIFDKAGNALLVKQQFAAMVAWFLKRDDNYSADLQTGGRTPVIPKDGTTQTLEEIEPGAFIRGNKGEDLQLKTANIPSAETMEHLRHTVQMICLNLNLPYCVGMLDGSRESFSSVRFVVDQAKFGWNMSRNRYDDQFYRQVAIFRTRRLLAEDRTLARLAGSTRRKRFNVFRHWWQKPAWPYPQPLHDASAGAIRLQTGQQSLIDHHAENGGNFHQFVRDSVGAVEHWIGAAIRETARLKQKYGDDARDVHWRDQYYRDFYKGGQAIDQMDVPNDANQVAGDRS